MCKMHKDVKKCKTLLVIEEMQIKVTMGFSFFLSNGHFFFSKGRYLMLTRVHKFWYSRGVGGANILEPISCEYWERSTFRLLFNSLASISFYFPTMYEKGNKWTCSLLPGLRRVAKKKKKKKQTRKLVRNH